MEKDEILKVCQNCQNYKRPKCKITNKFVQRKKICDDEIKYFKFKKNVKPILKKKIKTKESEADLKNQIFGPIIKGPEIQKPRKTKRK